LKILECIEILMLADEGGVFSDESRFDRGTMIGILDAGRGYGLSEIYKSNTRVHENFIQRVYPEYKEALQQDDCITIFEIPRTVPINTRMDGLLHVGPRDGHGGGFTKIRTRGQLSSRRRHRVHELAMSLRTHYLNDTTRGYLEIYKPDNKKIKHILVEGIFQHPTEIPGFNLEEDEYPITMDALKRVEDMVRRGTLLDTLKIPTNKISNSAEDLNVKRDIQTK